jgi:hypothetical protein
VAAQAEVRRLGVPPTPEGIRAARYHLGRLSQDHPAGGCVALRDFFYLSGCRDMLFQVREHRFTLPRIAAALVAAGARGVRAPIDRCARSCPGCSQRARLRALQRDGSAARVERLGDRADDDAGGATDAAHAARPPPAGIGYVRR